VLVLVLVLETGLGVSDGVTEPFLHQGTFAAVNLRLQSFEHEPEHEHEDD